VVFNMLMHNLQHANIVSVPTMMNACSVHCFVFFPGLSRQLQSHLVRRGHGAFWKASISLKRDQRKIIPEMVSKMHHTLCFVNFQRPERPKRTLTRSHGTPGPRRSPTQAQPTSPNARMEKTDGVGGRTTSKRARVDARTFHYAFVFVALSVFVLRFAQYA